jgi:hypothetical protein
MKNRLFNSIVVLMFLTAATVQAAFIVEVHETGRGYANFSSNGTPGYSSFAVSEAVGCIGANSAYGGDVDPDTYTFTYTPGIDVDNYSMSAGIDLGNDIAGNDVFSSGITGGATGLYNVYVSWPSSTNVSGGLTNIATLSDGGETVVSVNQDGDQVDATPGANEWVLVANDVSLTEGTGYTVTIQPTNSTFVSMRVQGVMWEAVPEPATLLLLSPGFLLFRRKR